MQKNKDYWVNFWLDYSKENKHRDAQTQVLRTLNKSPIDNEKWDYTLSRIEHYLDISKSDTILDLCCGNGLISEYFSPKCKTITSVDVSEDLVRQIATKNFRNLMPVIADIREIDFKPESFSKIIIYSGLQYLDYKETLQLIESAKKWLKIGGIFYIGDIPDFDSLWSFFNTEERERAYFDSIVNEKPIIGTWFTKNFLIKLANYHSYTYSKVISQHDEMFYSHYRFDFIMQK